MRFHHSLQPWLKHILSLITFTVDGMWGNWAAWADCPVTCGGDTQSRSRQCDNPARALGGDDCEGDAEETQVCGQGACDAVTNNPAAVSRSGSGKVYAILDQGFLTSLLFYPCFKHSKHKTNGKMINS